MKNVKRIRIKSVSSAQGCCGECCPENGKYFLITKVKMKNRLLSMAVIAVSLLLGSCIFYPKPNVRIFSKEGAMMLEASIYKGQVSPYYELTVGHPSFPIRQLPEVYIEIDEDQRVLLSEITPEYLFSNASESPFEESKYSDWPEGAFSIRIENENKSRSYYFVATRKKLLQFRTGMKPVIWNKEQTKRYTFPLSHQDAVELFGEPGTVVDFVRY